MAKKKNHVQRHNDALFTATAQKHLKAQLNSGLKQGAYAVCKVVHDKATAEGKTAEERLNDVIAFVSVFGGLFKTNKSGESEREVENGDEV